MSEEELEQQPSGGGNNKIILILVSVNIVAVLGVLVYLITSQGAAPAAVVVGGEAIAKPAQEEPGAPAVEDGPADRQPAGAGGYALLEGGARV